MDDEDYYETVSSRRGSDSNLWRNGPAKLFFDQLGIPEDCDLDYGSLLRFLPRETTTSNDNGNRPSGETADVEKEATSVESDARKVDSCELNRAIQSILLEDQEPGPSRGTSQELCEVSEDCVDATVQISKGAEWLNTFDTKSTGDTDTLKQRISEVEVSDAVNALLREMDGTTPTKAFCTSDSDDHESEVSETVKRNDGRKLTVDDFHLVNQVDWEKDIVWTPDAIKIEENSTATKLKQARAGWIPTMCKRKFEIDTEENSETKDFKPLFSLENDSLVEGDWEKEIIWDVEDFIEQNPQPKIPYFDATDEELVFQKPLDKDAMSQAHSTSNSSPTKPLTNSPPKKVIQPHAIKSKLLLGKAGFIQWKWQMEQQELKAKQLAAQKDPKQNGSNTSQERNSKKLVTDINFNLSNDEFYNSKEAMGSNDMLKICALNFIRHSKVVLDFLSPFMTTYLSEDELKNFHRPQLRNNSYAPRYPNQFKFSPCHAINIRKTKERNAILKDGHPVLLDRGADLTGVDGELILVENSEEHPPLISQVGMCSKIINYYKRKSLKDRYAHGVPHPYGETIFVYGTTSPFLGYLEPGQVLSALENNMYRSPIYLHSNPATDFLVVINKNGYFVREFDAIFTAGQQCPLIEVPEPNSTRSKLFLKNLLLMYIYRKFSKPPLGSTGRIKLSEVNKSFPGLFESTLKSWLKHCAEVKRVGQITWIVQKNGFVLPDENELKEMVTPEQCCAYYSLLAAEQRLKDAGCDSMLSLPERAEGAAAEPTDLVADPTKKPVDDNDELTQSKLVEELKAAPWNTTAAFVAASKGKCLLQITGPADPTGCGEGFSYIRVAKKGTQQSSQEQKKRQWQTIGAYTSSGAQPGARPGGTDADLRKLSSKQAKDILRRAGVPEKEISKLSRWEVIDVLRTLSTEKAKQGESDDKGIGKFSRWKNKTNSVMNQERYREDCQRVFDLQNKVLSSAEVLSTDDEEEDEDNQVTVTTQADINQMGRNLEQILREGKTASELAHEEEELERLELQKMMLGEIQEKDADIAKKAELLKRSQEQKKKEDDLLKDLINHPGRKLKISRTFKENGKTFLRTEIVRDPVVIAAYLKIRTTKSEEFIKDFLYKADRQQRKEEKLKEKMLLTEIQDKRVVQNALVNKIHKKRKRDMEAEYFPTKAAKVKAERELSKVARKCGACGLLGHTRSSVVCPLYNPDKLKKVPALKVKVVSGLKSEKRGRGRPPMNRENYGLVPVVKPPKMSKQMTEVMKKSNLGDDNQSSSSDSSDDEQDSSSEYTDSSSVDSDDAPPAEDQTMVKVDGLKMVLKVPQVMVKRAQIEEQQEEEAARILLSISNYAASARGASGSGGGSSSVSGGGSGGIPRRRCSQAEREHADYLNVPYKTTAADRIRKRD